MAKKAEATLLLKIKEQGARTFDSIGRGLASINKHAVVGGAALTAGTAAATKLALDAAKFADVGNAFSNMAKSQGRSAEKMLANMKEMSGGTISELELMTKANNAMLLGLPVDRFGDMLKIARSSAKATGQSMDFMFQSIVTGLGRGSKLVLDNLGIVFKVEDAYKEFAATMGRTASSLSEAEKKQAFLNKALQTGLENTEKSGKLNENLTDSWAKMKAGISDLAISIGTDLEPAIKIVVDRLSQLIIGFDKLWKSGNKITFS